MSRFIEEPDIRCAESDNYFILDSPLIYASDLLGCIITVPIGFVTDLASIPFKIKWAHREGILHDYGFRINSTPLMNYAQANALLFEAMTVKNKSWITRWGIWTGVTIGGWLSFHKKLVEWKP